MLEKKLKDFDDSVESDVNYLERNCSPREFFNRIKQMELWALELATRERVALFFFVSFLGRIYANAQQLDLLSQSSEQPNKSD